MPTRKQIGETFLFRRIKNVENARMPRLIHNRLGIHVQAHITILACEKAERLVGWLAGWLAGGWLTGWLAELVG